MSAYQLTKTRFREGVWEGVLTSSSKTAQPPELLVTLRGERVPGVSMTEMAPAGPKAQGFRWLVQVPVPVSALGDGAQTVLMSDAATDTVLETFTLIAGEELAEDIRAEVDLLRAELDMLKRAFRRHCLETT